MLRRVVNGIRKDIRAVFAVEASCKKMIVNLLACPGVDSGIVLLMFCELFCLPVCQALML